MSYFRGNSYPIILLFYYPIILLSYYPIILLSYYPIILLSYYFIILLFYYVLFLIKDHRIFLLYNSSNILAKDSRLKRWGGLLGYRDLLAVIGLVLVWRR